MSKKILVLNEIEKVLKKKFLNVLIMDWVNIEDMYFSIENDEEDYLKIEVFGEIIGNSFYTNHYHKFMDVFEVGDTDEMDYIINEFLDLDVPDDCSSEEYDMYEDIEWTVKNIIEEELEEIIYQNIARLNIVKQYLNIA